MQDKMQVSTDSTVSTTYHISHASLVHAIKKCMPQAPDDNDLRGVNVALYKICSILNK